MQADLLSAALAHHQRGELEQAARLYKQLLAERPDHPDALHLLGLSFLQGGDIQRALQLIERAIAVLPSTTAFHANLAEAYRFAGQFDRAISDCRSALRLQADYPEPHNTLGLVCLDRGRPADALEHFQAALRLRPGFALRAQQPRQRLPAAGRRAANAAPLPPRRRAGRQPADGPQQPRAGPAGAKAAGRGAGAFAGRRPLGADFRRGPQQPGQRAARDGPAHRGQDCLRRGAAPQPQAGHDSQ